MKTHSTGSRSATYYLPGKQPGRRMAALVTWVYALAVLVNAALLITRPSRHG